MKAAARLLGALHRHLGSAPAWAPGSRPAAALCLLLLAGGVTGCSALPKPGSTVRPPSSPAVVTVLVPGVTGSAMREAEGGRFVWGHGKNLLFPRDGAYSLALPFAVSAGNEPSNLIAGPVLDQVRLAFFRKEVYGKILDHLVDAGWQLGDLEDPAEADTLFAFAYDWRRDNVVSARLLVERLQALRAVRGGGPLTVNLICQSNGGHICRYAAKYGGASRDEAEAGSARPPEDIRIDTMILVGTANGGSMRILRELDRGRVYLPWIGRPMLPEVLFTFPALYQDLPAYRQDLFVDPNGRDLPIDLYDPQSWVENEWSIFGARAARRANRRPELFGIPAERLAFLTRTLREARRLQELLHRDSPHYEPPRYFLLQNAFEPTADRAVCFPPAAYPNQRHALGFTGDRRVDRSQYLSVRTRAPGDGHATVASQSWLSPQEQAALTTEPFYVPGGHFEMILEPAMLRRLLEILLEP